jgi:hypothetical protein
MSALWPVPQPNRVALASGPFRSRDQIVTYDVQRDAYVPLGVAAFGPRAAAVPVAYIVPFASSSQRCTHRNVLSGMLSPPPTHTHTHARARAAHNFSMRIYSCST